MPTSKELLNKLQCNSPKRRIQSLKRIRHAYVPIYIILSAWNLTPDIHLAHFSKDTLSVRVIKIPGHRIYHSNLLSPQMHTPFPPDPATLLLPYGTPMLFICCLFSPRGKIIKGRLSVVDYCEPQCLQQVPGT